MPGHVLKVKDPGTIQEQSFLSLQRRQVCKRILHFFKLLLYLCVRQYPLWKVCQVQTCPRKRTQGPAVLPSRAELLESALLTLPCVLLWGVVGCSGRRGPELQRGLQIHQGSRTEPAGLPSLREAEMEAQRSWLLLPRVQADSRIRLPRYPKELPRWLRW